MLKIKFGNFWGRKTTKKLPTGLSDCIEGVAATINWVHPNSGVGFFIKDKTPALSGQRQFFTQPRGYRFANFLHCYLKIQNGQIANYGFYPDSQLYKGLSFFKIPCKSYPVLRNCRQFEQAGVNGVEFEQVAGARTLSHTILGGVSGAIVGGLVGAVCGILVARRLMDFPPIWTHLQVRLYANGKQEASVMRHSFFPSYSLYTNPVTSQKANSKENYYLASSYIARHAEQALWSKKGWNAHNPWNIRRPFI